MVPRANWRVLLTEWIHLGWKNQRDFSGSSGAVSCREEMQCWHAAGDGPALGLLHAFAQPGTLS